MKVGLKILLPALLSPLLLGGGYVALGNSLPMPFGSQKNVAQPTQTAVPEPDPLLGITFSTQERVVTLADKQALRYLKTEVVLEFEPDASSKPTTAEAYKKAQEELSNELAPLLPAIEDAITIVLTSQTVADIASPDGKDRLKHQLAERLNALPIERHVANVYFTQFIIQ